MKTFNQVIEEYKVQVESSFPSIYTKVDVIQLLNSLEVSLQDVPRGTDISRIMELVKDEIEDVVSTEYISDNVELSLDGTNIDVHYDEDNLVRRLKDMVDKVVYDELEVDM
jgi:uncharacterized membrane protein YheB (UPF0754 family)